MDSDASLDKKLDQEHASEENLAAKKSKEQIAKEEKAKEEASLNCFATIKTIGQVVLDLALLVSNIKKLIVVNRLKPKERKPRHTVLIVAICLSIAMQVMVGALMGIIALVKLKPGRMKVINILNNVITVLASLISVLNIALISAIDI